MKKRLIVFILGIILFCCGQNTFAEQNSQQASTDEQLKLWVPYDPKNPNYLNNLDNKYIFIRDKDLEQIKNTRNLIKTVSGDPPVSYGITSVSYSAKIVNDTLKIKGIYNINKLDDEWVLIPVISDKTGISSATLGQKPAFMVNNLYTIQNRNKFKNINTIKPGYHYLVLKNKGNYTLQLDFTENIQNSPARNTRMFSFNLPRIPVTKVEFAVNEKDTVFQVDNAVSMQTVSTESGSQLVSTLPPVEKIEVKWSPKSKIVDVSNKNIHPSVNAVTYSRIELGRGTLKGSFIADVDIRRSSLSEFEFFIPEDIEIDSIEVKNNDLIDPYPEIKDNILPLELVSPVEGEVKFIINYRKSFDDSSFTTKIPAITLVNDNIDRETGFVAAVETTNIETSVVKADTTKNYRIIDSCELEGELRGAKASIALKYTKTKDSKEKIPYDITIKAIKHKDVAVYEASLESAYLTSVLNRKGEMFTKACMQVKNTGKQFLEISLPENSSLWSVYVDNKSVKPALKDEQKGVYAVPLVKSIDHGGRAFSVEVVYFTDQVITSSGWLPGMVNLKAMTTELVANAINWRVYIPEKTDFYSLIMFSNLLQEEKRTYVSRNRSAMDILGLAKKAEMPEEARAVGMNKMRSKFTQKPQAESQQLYRQPYKSKKVGKLPVYVDLPTIGQSYSFYQLSFEANEFPSVSALIMSPVAGNLLILLIIGITVYFIYKAIKKGVLRSAEFILSIIVLAVATYIKIGLHIIWLALVGALIILFKKNIIKNPGLKSKKLITIVGAVFSAIIPVILGLFFIPGIIIPLAVFLLGLGLVAVALYVIYRAGRFVYGKIQQKRHSQEDNEQDFNMEGSN